MIKYSFFLNTPSQDGGESDYRIARLYIANGNYPYAHCYLAKAAHQGHPAAYYELGNMYLFGINVAPNYPKAKFFFEKAVEKNHEGAWNHLGLIYAYGLGTEVDKERASQCFAKAGRTYPEQTRQEIIDGLFKHSEALKMSACWRQSNSLQELTGNSEHNKPTAHLNRDT